MRQLIPTAAMCLLLAGFAVAGCGGGGGGGDKGGSTGAGGEGAATAETGEGEAPGTGETSEGEAPGTGESGAGTAPKPGSKPLSKAEFVAKANALCGKRSQQVQAKLSEIFKSSPANGSQQKALRLVVEEAVAPAMEAEAAELRALGAPPGDEGKVGAIAAALEAVVAEAREDPQGVAADSAAFEKPEQAAREYGIGSCGSA